MPLVARVPTFPMPRISAQLLLCKPEKVLFKPAIVLPNGFLVLDAARPKGF
jgi:hypothetical protein